jgi:trimethylamine:corrinoid methyltransferase-like protein
MEMCEARAASLGKPLSEVFTGYVCFVAPLTLASHQADQMMFFHDCGLRVGMVSMLKAGANAPVTMAGCLALNLADAWAHGIINREPARAGSIPGRDR